MMILGMVRVRCPCFHSDGLMVELDGGNISAIYLQTVGVQIVRVLFGQNLIKL